MAAPRRWRATVSSRRDRAASNSTTSVSVVDSGTITAATSPHVTGTVDVVVTNPDATTATLPSAFYYAPLPVATVFYTVQPCRILDTRNPPGPFGGPSLVAGAVRTFVLTGQCGIPAGAKALSVNITVTQSQGAGFLTLYQSGILRPQTSTINYRAGQTRANNAIVSVGSGGELAVFTGQAGGTADFILDVNGYFQ